MLVRRSLPLVLLSLLTTAASAKDSVVLRIDPSVTTDRETIPLIKALLRDTVDVSIGPPPETALPTAPPTEVASPIVARVTSVELDGRPAVRVVVIDAARGLRLDVDATPLTPDADIGPMIASSIDRAVVKAQQPITRLCIVAPTIPLATTPVQDAQGFVRPSRAEPTIDDAIIATLLALPGVAVPEIEYRTMLCPVPAMDATPVFADAARWTISAVLVRNAETSPSALAPSTLSLALIAPDGSATFNSQSTLEHANNTRGEAAKAARDLARKLAATDVTPRSVATTRPISELLADTAGPAGSSLRIDTLPLLLEAVVAQTPGDVAVRRQLAAAYVEVISRPAYDPRRATFIAPETPEISELDLKRRLGLRARAMVHTWAARDAIAVDGRDPSNGARDPLLLALDAQPSLLPFDSRTRDAITAAANVAMQWERLRYEEWAAARRAAGKFDESRYAVRAFDRRPADEQVAALRDYVTQIRNEPGLIERMTAFRTFPSTASTQPAYSMQRTPRRPLEVSAMFRATADARWRQASRAANERRADAAGAPQPSPDSFMPIVPRTLPPRQPRPGQPDQIRWTPIAGVPFERTTPDQSGRHFGWYGPTIVEFNGSDLVTPKVLFTAIGPSGECGHVFDVTFDGERLFASVFRPWLPDGAPALLVLDPRDQAARFFGTEDGLPATDADRLTIEAIAPGKLFVVGANDRTWFGTVTIKGQHATTDVIGETAPLPPNTPFGDTTTRPVPRLRPTTAEADDVQRAFVPSDVVVAGRNAEGRPTHAFVMRDFNGQSRPLVVSLADRRVVAFADPVMPGGVFVHGGEAYTTFPRRSITTTRPATTRISTSRPSTNRQTIPTGQTREIVRLDREAARYVTVCDNALPFPMFGPAKITVAPDGRLFLTSERSVAVSDGPTKPFRQLLPGYDRARTPGTLSQIEAANAEQVLLWDGERRLRGELVADR